MPNVALAATNEIRIDKGIPLPEQYGSRRRFPFEKMEVGDSFEYIANGSTRTGVYALVENANKRLAPMKFVGKMKNGQSRIWRIA